MFFKCIPDGLLQSNVYIIGHKGECVVVDCGCKAERIIDVCIQNNLKIKYIILTHGHYDHMVSVDEVRNKTGASLLIHKADADKLLDPIKNGSLLFAEGGGRTYKKADIELKGGETFKVGDISFNIIHTPGHSAGGICVHIKDILITGDTLFKGSVGRTDLGDGNMAQLLNSIKSRILPLQDFVRVYPGHGQSTTIGRERNKNPYLI